VAVLRTLLGESLRTTRLQQDRTLREVSSAAQVSLGYLSEVERGQKEASSELLASICRALGVRLSDVLREVSESLSVLEPEPTALPAALPRAVPDTLPAARPAVVPASLPATRPASLPAARPDTVPDTVPAGLPALEPVGADGGPAPLRAHAAGPTASVHAVRDVVAA
jgi:transcriptional regulator with XRE-family HTH domain